MASSVAKLFLISALCAFFYVKVEATTVTIVDITTDIPGNDIVEDWSSDLVDNLISSTIKIKQNCPGSVEADIKIYQGENMVKQMTQKLNKPMKDVESYSICETIDSPEIEDDCSIGEGDQVAQNCDIRKWFSDMSTGDYKVVCEFKQADVITTVTINVNIVD